MSTLWIIFMIIVGRPIAQRCVYVILMISFNFRMVCIGLGNKSEIYLHFKFNLMHCISFLLWAFWLDRLGAHRNLCAASRAISIFLWEKSAALFVWVWLIILISDNRMHLCRLFRLKQWLKRSVYVFAYVLFRGKKLRKKKTNQQRYLIPCVSAARPHTVHYLDDARNQNHLTRVCIYTYSKLNIPGKPFADSVFGQK